jgi:hypothetical protein
MLYTQAIIRTAGVVTHEDKEDRGLEIQTWGNILVLNDTTRTIRWLSRNSFTAITKAEAQTIYDAYIDSAIASYVADEDDEEKGRAIAERATLP